MKTVNLNRSFVILDEVGDPVSNQVFSGSPTAASRPGRG